MGKTKTAFVGGTEGADQKPSYDKVAKEAKRKAREGGEKVRVPGLKGGQRITAVEAELIPVEDEAIDTSATTSSTAKPKVRSKKYKEANAKVDKNRQYALSEAISLVKETSYSSFDGTMELHLIIKKEGFSTNVALPYSAGKLKKIEIADDDTIENLKKGKVEFDVLLATADMMPKLVPFARLLGPRGLMPNPKTGTLLKNKKDADNFSASTTTIKTEKKAPVIHTAVGKVSQKDEELQKNIEAIFEAIGAKQVLRTYLKATMSPSVRVRVS